MTFLQYLALAFAVAFLIFAVVQAINLMMYAIRGVRITVGDQIIRAFYVGVPMAAGLYLLVYSGVASL